MASKYFTSLLALAATALSQTPPDFTPSADQLLPVTYDQSATPKFFVTGGLFDKAAVQDTPSIYIPDTPELTGQTFLILMVDPDAPSPSNNSLGQILHWLQPSVKVPLDTQKTKSPQDESVTLLKLDTTSTNAIVPYRGPAPPSQDPHRYIFMLFLQPEATFSLPAGFEKYQGGNDRRLFNADKFVEAAGLKAPVLGNYFLSGKNTMGDGSSGIEDFNGNRSGNSSTPTSSADGGLSTGGVPPSGNRNSSSPTFPTPSPTETGKNGAGMLKGSLMGVMAAAGAVCLTLLV